MYVICTTYYNMMTTTFDIELKLEKQKLSLFLSPDSKNDLIILKPLVLSTKLRSIPFIFSFVCSFFKTIFFKYLYLCYFMELCCAYLMFTIVRSHKWISHNNVCVSILSIHILLNAFFF